MNLPLNNLPVTEIVVCTTCRESGASRDLPADGLALFEAVQEALLISESDAPNGLGLRVREQACMSGCSRACTVAFQAAGKHTYVIGDLLADAETAADVLICARLHHGHPDGTMAWGDRPERLRRGILAKVPPAFESPAQA
jgi:predicted metal-binding protein